jgi:hypothetical protein
MRSQFKMSCIGIDNVKDVGVSQVGLMLQFLSLFL